MKPIWFKAKKYGWGWYPATWQGWAVTAIYLLLILALSSTLDENSPNAEVAFMFFLPLITLSACFVLIAYKTGEKPEWRWGNKK